MVDSSLGSKVDDASKRGMLTCGGSKFKLKDVGRHGIFSREDERSHGRAAMAEPEHSVAGERMGCAQATSPSL